MQNIHNMYIMPDIIYNEEENYDKGDKITEELIRFKDQNNDGTESYDWLMKAIIDLETEQGYDLGNILIDMFNPKSVIDIGCGPSNYLLPFKARDIDVLGIDACETAGQCIPSHFERVDLRFLYKPTRKFDIALCIEVAEHLRSEYAETLVESCINCSDLIVFCAAHEGQGGHYHWNCKNKPYWIDIFNKFGYINHEREQELLDRIREEVRMERDKWLLTNTQLFRKV